MLNLTRVAAAIICLAAILTFSNAFRMKRSILLKRTSNKIFQGVETTVDSSPEIEERVINISSRAMEHLISLKNKQEGEVCLRMGVRAGGCSGMSYVMDLIPAEQITSDDHEEVYEGIRYS